MPKYAFVKGSPFSGDADEVQEELERIRRTGGLTPGAVLAVAKPKNSVLHRHIIYTDKNTAAEHSYLHRARQLIGSIVLVNIETGEPTSTRVHVRLGPETKGADSTYISIDAEGARALAINRLERAMAALQHQLEELEMYPEVAAVLREALAA